MTHYSLRCVFTATALAGCLAFAVYLVPPSDTSADLAAETRANVEIVTGDVAVCPGDTVEFIFVTRMLGGFEGLQFRNIFVESSICTSVDFVGGDVNGNGYLDFGEEFTNSCSATVFLSQTHFAADGADVYFNDQMFGTVNGNDTSEVIILNCDDGCTLTLGYWKTHPEDWPLEDVTVGGVTYTRDEALEILNMEVVQDATIIVFHQLVPAILNLANGAAPEAIADTILAADEWLTANPPGGNPRGRERHTGVMLGRELDDFNNGEIGPGHCDD